MRKSTATVRTKQMECKYCGEPVTVGRNQRKAPNHLECGLKAAIDAQRQMSNKSGPVWDKYETAMRNRWVNR